MKTLDFSDYVERQEPQTTVILHTMAIRLDRKSMIELLSCERVVLDGLEFEIPPVTIRHLGNCLAGKIYGQTAVTLKLI